MKIAYFGYDFFYTCLEMLVNKGYEVTNIFSHITDDHYNFHVNIDSIASRIGVDVKKERVTSEDIIALYNNECELIISAAYPYKIPILDTHPIRGINIHPTLLPEGRGPWPLPYIILNEFETSGVTIHKLARKMDFGDILIQKDFQVSPNEDLETLSCKCQVLATSLLQEFIQNINWFWDHAISQSTGSYWPMPSESLMNLDWTKSVKELDKIARAFGKFDSCTQFDNHHWIVQDLNGWIENHNYNCGEVVHKTNKEVMIAVQDGFVCLRFFQLDLDYED
jgi:methionyl-tRNA formyltransferase